MYILKGKNICLCTYNVFIFHDHCFQTDWQGLRPGAGARVEAVSPVDEPHQVVASLLLLTSLPQQGFIFLSELTQSRFQRVYFSFPATDLALQQGLLGGVLNQRMEQFRATRKNPGT